jgi:hypothetical protein
MISLPVPLNPVDDAGRHYPQIAVKLRWTSLKALE